MHHFNTRFSIVVYLIFVCSIVFFDSCSFSVACELKITGKYIESSCGLTNGVRFEELIVDTFYADGKPKIYKVICSYAANPYANGPADKVEDRIYFDGKNGDCYWWKDSATNGVYKNFGVSRERIESRDSSLQDSVIETRTYITEDSMVVTGGKPTSIDLYSARAAIKCPLDSNQIHGITWIFTINSTRLIYMSITT